MGKKVVFSHTQASTKKARKNPWQSLPISKNRKLTYFHEHKKVDFLPEYLDNLEE